MQYSSQLFFYFGLPQAQHKPKKKQPLYIAYRYRAAKNAGKAKRNSGYEGNEMGTLIVSENWSDFINSLIESL